MAFSAGEVQEAVDAVHTYLLDAGREGKFYREALELLEEAEQREQLQSWIGDEQTCAGQPKGAECWKELTGQPGCYVWDNYLITDQTVTWTGTCSGGRAQGEGTLKWVWEDGEKTSESTGSLTDGKMHGPSVIREADGGVWEGPYVDGKRHGQWVIREADGDVWEGPYVDGKRHGQWVFREAEGPYGRQEAARLIRKGTEVPYVDGKPHGQWVERYTDGTVGGGGTASRPVGRGGRPLCGRQEARPVGHSQCGGRRPGRPLCGRQGARPVGHSQCGGQVQEGPYVDGKSARPVGHSQCGRADVQEGPYVDGKRHGQWVIRNADGKAKMHGQWVERWTFGGGGKRHGPYVDGKMHGQWVERFADGRVEQLTYEDGEEVRRSSGRQTGSAAAGRGRCQVPGYPNPPGGVSNLGFSWCPASVGLQVRSFALQAAGAECAIATGSSSTPEQIEARRREIRAACDRLSALGQGNCQCPAGLGQ